MNQYTNIHGRNYQIQLTEGSPMCHHREVMVSLNNKSSKVKDKGKIKSAAQKMVVPLSRMSHHNNCSQTIVTTH